MYQGLQTVQDARVLFLDMNSFFASVEQQNRPELRDKPVAVVSHITPRGTVLAASYEAKAFGVKTGTKVEMARILCPDILFTETSAKGYRSVHEKFMTILTDLCGPEVLPRSIDEAAIFLSPNHYGSDSAWKLAALIKKTFREQLGDYIRCSIGIAPNMLLAKVASNLQKPDGLSEITLANLQTILGSLELTDLPGIATKNAHRLGELGIETPLDFYHASPNFLQDHFGIWGRYWSWRLHGYEPDGNKSISKSISHEHVLPKWVYQLGQVEPIIDKMSDRLIYRLQRNGFQCRTVWLYLSLSGAAGLYAERHFDSPVNSYQTLSKAIHQLFKGHKELVGPIRKISVCFQGLSEDRNGLQLDLFERRAKIDDLSKAMYSVREKHGFDALKPASILSVRKGVAEEQLGFGRIKDRYG